MPSGRLVTAAPKVTIVSRSSQVQRLILPKHIRHTAGRRMMTAHASAAQPQAAQESAGAGAATDDAIPRLAASTPAFAAITAVQDECLQVVKEQLGLEAVSVPDELVAAARGTQSADGLMHLVAADGASSTTAVGFQAAGVRWLSASTVASTSFQFGATRLLAFAGNGREVPHLSLGQKIEGGKIQVTASLLPRRTLILDRDYFKRFYGTAPADGIPCYNDLFAACISREGWRYYVSPSPEARLLLEGALSFTFEPSEENLQHWSQAARDLTRLWAAQVKASRGAQAGARDEATALYDACYVAEMNAVVAMIALWLFNNEASEALKQAMTGSRR